MNEKRVRVLKEGEPLPGPVIYWMSREQRVADNWALLHAQGLAIERKAPLAVAFCLVPGFLGATARQYAFMFEGLKEVEEGLSRKNITFCLLSGKPEEALPEFVRLNKVGVLVTDFDPLRVKRQWKAAVCRRVSVPVREVDAHNVVPCWAASDRQEYAAYTLRPKIKRLLPEFLDDIPSLKRHPFAWKGAPGRADWQAAMKTVKADRGVPPADWISPGEKAARRALRDFVSGGLRLYHEKRNDPTEAGQSGLSPYLHFGHLSPQRVALAVSESPARQEAKQAFLEELIVRRELSDNFCFHNEHYDGFEGFPAWARGTLDRHRKDRRPYIYTLREFEAASTHDDLWNAAQTEMLRKGKMHGFMRMYWAKKILEWSESPEQALRTAIYLNDRYELDGRDPNGYTGIAWSIGGVHDRAWAERPVFGKVRYMSYGGCKAKFDVRKYIEQVGSPPG